MDIVDDVIGLCVALSVDLVSEIRLSFVLTFLLCSSNVRK